MKLPEPKIDTWIVADAETYYDPKKGYTLSKTTTVQYVRHPDFQVIGWGVSVNGADPVWLEEADFLRWAKTVDWSRAAVIAHNTLFDGFILADRYGVRPAAWFDTLSLGRALHGTEVGGSLGKLAKHYGVGEKGDEVVRAQGKRREHFSPAEWKIYGDYCRNDVLLTARLFEKMAPQVSERELWLIDTTLRFFTEPAFQLDEPLLRDFLAQEKQSKADLLERITADKSVLMSNDKFATLLTSLGVDPPTKVSAPKSKTASEKAGFPVEVETFAFSKSDPGMQELLEHETEEVRWLAEARIGVKSTINETRTERLIALGEGGKQVPVALKYCGAHTGRWSGTDRMNFQNLPRGGTLRKALLAPEGFSLVVADSGQIEARIVAWVARHTALLETFSRNDAKTAEFKKTGKGEKGDVYADFASDVFGYKVTEATHPVERFNGKTALLGCGYGLGGFKYGQTVMTGKKPVQFKRSDADKFGVDVQKWAAERPWRTGPSNAERTEETPSRLPYAERLVHFAVASHIVKLYRERNQPIKAFWDEMRSVLEIMLDDNPNGGKGHAFGPGGCLKAIRHGIILPSGRRIRYPGLAKSGNGFSYLGGHRGKQREKAYGGSVTENIVQALARDVIADQLLAVRFMVEELGGRVLTTTHDEIVAMVPDAQAEGAFERMLTLMRTPSEWCLDLPLNASGGFGKRYGEIK